jgi:hypothetical protein
MRSLLIVSLSILSSFSYSMTCGSSLKKIDSVVTAYANCPSCVTMNDFALTGASMLYDNGGFRNVILSRGANKALVTLRGSYRSTPISFGIFGFSWNIRATNYAERLVTAIPMGGSVPGSPWSDQKTHVSALKAKCQQIEEEEEEDDTSYDLIDVTAVVSGNYGQSSWNFGSGTSSWLRGGGLFGWRDTETTTTGYPPGTPVEEIRPCSASYCQMY